MNWISRLFERFRWKRITDLKPIRRTIYRFLNDKDDDTRRLLKMISRVAAKRCNNSVRITIWTHDPGMLIGKKGSLVNGLYGKLKDELFSEVNIHIDIKECQLWKDLF